MQIFISIASYQDPLLKNTIEDAYDKALHKESLVFGICDQSDDPLDLSQFSYADQIRYEHVETIFSRGPCWARTRIQELFQDEDFYLQIDSHTLFEQRWDKILIDALNEIKNLGKNSEYHRKPFLTGYPRSFEYNEELKAFEKHATDKNILPIGYRKDSLFMRDRFSRQIGLRTNKQGFAHGYLLAAGCLFAEGRMIREVPYDQYFYFYGEEISLMLRLFTHGYSAFHMSDLPIFHLYTNHETNKRLLHWSPEEDQNRSIKWHELEKKSIERLTDLVLGNPLNGYGLGNLRTLEDYKILSGIDMINKEIVDEARATTSEFFEKVNWEDIPI
jgi:hypothetical protein